MLIRNKDLEKLNVLYNERKSNKEFFKEHGFEPCETYSLDFTTLCFFYTRLIVFVEQYEKTVVDEVNLASKIKELIKKLENAIKNFNTLSDEYAEEYKKLLSEIIEILPLCWW